MSVIKYCLSSSTKIRILVIEAGHWQTSDYQNILRTDGFVGAIFHFEDDGARFEHIFIY